MSSGTLVPFMSELALPGDSFDIELNCDVKTLPTIGPLFGSYKVQLDVFECPIRLYNGKLHMNMLNIGMNMSDIKLPQMQMVAKYDSKGQDDNEQVNPSSIYSYLDIRGLGRTKTGTSGNIQRAFNAVPYLGYWDIYKNYYANKQEEDGVVIHMEDLSNEFTITASELKENGVNMGNIIGQDINVSTAEVVTLTLAVSWLNTTQEESGGIDLNTIRIEWDGQDVPVTAVWNDVVLTETAIPNTYSVECSGYAYPVLTSVGFEITDTTVGNTVPAEYGEPQLKKFPLENIDKMRENILANVASTTAYNVSYLSDAPYGLGLDTENGVPTGDFEDAYCKRTQEGLAIKTYQSDLFNNWISTEWIDGANGVNAVTAVDTSGGDFTIDALNLANKVYTMLNRIAISGGSYDDWLDAVYTHERAKSVESPVYHGSLIKELGFEEVIAQADTELNGEIQPLGTLAGRGRLSGKNKGGKMKVKVHEPSYIIGIVSLTPRIDYSQGNKWDTNLKTMNDLHKPALDEIGYQDLITDQMAWFDTVCNVNQGGWYTEFKSAGKQPAWINYMTAVNKTRGNFAVQTDSMFMTLNRRYERGGTGIEDLTTYVDPSKYNNIFAQTDRSSQNFWCQIGTNITARRKMSAKVIPNL
jgi:hypothetical protein